MHFLREIHFELLPHEAVHKLDFDVCHPKAAIEFAGLHSRPYADSKKYTSPCGLLLVRDRGEPEKATLRKSVYVVRRMSRWAEIPEDAGPVVGAFTSEAGRYAWAVLLVREPRAGAPRAAGGSPASPSLPRNGSASPRTPSRPASSAPRSAQSPLPSEAAWFPDD